MRSILIFILLLAIFQLTPAPPVDKKKPKDNEHLEKEEVSTQYPDEPIDFGLEYGRYLQQIVQALEEDTDFAKKLENVSVDQIKSGEVAKELEFVQHSVRTKLDELKRIELERIRELVKQANANSLDGSQIKVPKHLDFHNEHTFEVKDLQKLIQTATKDLEMLDKERQKEFKNYEMEKEYRYREDLKNMTEEEKKEAVKHHDDLVQKHKDHPKVHHPGSKQQLEQVWEEKDHLPKDEFNPKTFFALHDVNSDGYWDVQEVEALLTVEVKKMYDSQQPEDDPIEMEEEYHRMRQHIYKESDTNHDGLISRQEFLDMTKRADFEQDEGWKGLDEQQIYSEDDLKEYEKFRKDEMKRMVDQYGPNYRQQYYPDDQQYYQYYPSNELGQGGQYPQHPSQGGQQYPQHPQDGQQYQQHPQGGAQYQQHPQGGPQFQQHPQGGQQFQQHPQGGQQFQQHPQGGPQYQQHPQGGPQYQQHPQGGPQFQQHPSQGGPQHPQQGGPQYQQIPSQQGQNYPHPSQNMPPQGKAPNHPQQGIPQPPAQGMPQQGIPQHPAQGMPQQGIPQHPAQGIQQGIPQHPAQGMPQQGIPQHPAQGIPQQGIPQHPAQGIPQQGIPQHPAQGMPQQGVPQGLPKQVEPQNPPKANSQSQQNPSQPPRA